MSHKLLSCYVVFQNSFYLFVFFVIHYWSKKDIEFVALLRYDLT